MKENEIAEFYADIYQRTWWVVVGRGRYEERFDGVSEWGEDAYAMVECVRERESGRGGLLVRFASVEDITFENVAHVAFHVASEIYRYCGIKAELENQEHMAYLIGWAANCMGSVRDAFVQ